MLLWTAGATLAHAPDGPPFALALGDALSGMSGSARNFHACVASRPQRRRHPALRLGRGHSQRGRTRPSEVRSGLCAAFLCRCLERIGSRPLRQPRERRATRFQFGDDYARRISHTPLPGGEPDDAALTHPCAAQPVRPTARVLVRRPIGPPACHRRARSGRLLRRRWLFLQANRGVGVPCRRRRDALRSDGVVGANAAPPSRP